MPSRKKEQARIEKLAKSQGVSQKHAAELLRSGYESKGKKNVKRSTVQKLAPLISQDDDDAQILSKVAGYYHDTLKESPEALDYLAQKGLSHDRAIAHFRLGFANRTLGYRLPNKQRHAGKAIRTRLEKLGIYRPSGHENLTGCITIPVFDDDNEVVQMVGYRIKRQRQEDPAELYLPSLRPGLWNQQGLNKEIIICSSVIDALTFWANGIKNVTTGIDLDIFHKQGVERVLIAYIRGPEGDKAAEKLSKKLVGAGIGTYRVKLPLGMSVNEFALKDSKGLENLIRYSVWMGQGEAPGLSFEASNREEPGEPELPAETAPDEDPSDFTPPSPVLREPPAQAEPEVPTELRDQEVLITLGDRRWRIRGLEKNLSFQSLRLNILVSREAPDQDSLGFHVDTLELYSARHRAAFVKEACEELNLEPRVIKRDLGKVLLKCESLQEQNIRDALEPDHPAIELSEEEKDEAFGFLKSPDLLDQILSDFEKCGTIGERTNKLVGYLAATSRLLDEPLAVLIQSSSAAGKSSLMEAILDFIPNEDRTHFSAMTGQSLYYMGESNLEHKILAVVEEAGARRTSYALKLLQTERELTIASTAKEAKTGRLVTESYRVKGPVMIILTTTAIEIDEELLNRCVVLTVDEGREQTREIHRIQRRKQTLEGVLESNGREGIVRKHRNAQRLLVPLKVINPYAVDLTFMDHQTRTRRDHLKYLGLIKSIALLHQFQRPVKEIENGNEKIQYIEVIPEDIRVANRLASEALGRSLDELPPQTRNLLGFVYEMVTGSCKSQGIDQSDFRFTRRHVREHTQWGATALKIHLKRLEELEYLIVHRGTPGRRYLYELVYRGEGQNGSPFLPGLLSLDSHAYDQNRSGQNDEWSPHGQAIVTPKSGGCQGGKFEEKINKNDPLERSRRKKSKKGYSGSISERGSYTKNKDVGVGS